MINQIISLSKKLIEVPSVQENKKALKKVLEVAKKELKEFTIEEFEKNSVPSLLVYHGKTRPKRFKIILNAHLDVVPGPDRMFKPVVKKNRLYGRGAYDMKTAAAIELLVFKEMAQKVPYPLALQIVTDEEVGGFNGTKYQIEKGVRAGFVIAGEPTRFGVNNKAKGILWVKIKTSGKSAHGAYVWQGTNAILIMNQVLSKLIKLFPIPKKNAWKTTVNVARIETTNQTFNKIPDNCTALLDIRYRPEDKKTLLEKIKKVLPENTTMEVVSFEPPQFTDKENPYVLILRDSVKRIGGKLAPVVAKHGSSDIRHFNQVGCDGVTFGPWGLGSHTDNEWVAIRSLSYYYLMLKDFLKSLE
ncbi:hypothetical protein COT62_00565 [Candidatus Roizmanbacteria bacterium CG09_land_8_20_14_0_10_41_9]|uniref:Peptidase M20 dimerisation domain-containing protein n=1 Tax=Candidatus Roizmanbacteria bacterium CG09_land_8_20_14_0_10_41_9 TaxID=1974850 RepID=A0A2H0WTP5_9BACT|nr:MAG: hypothetical protein COT62_00565 [Candidatus Roizmanbacteria bacterium CG09_land_8_20_14_0_10_41_9]